MSGAATMRNAVKRVTHKERAQPSARKKFGLLEKHKDYKERANDYKKKQTTITRLRRKALDRNPDEFYYKMNKSQLKKGVHKEESASAGTSLDHDTLRALKQQDLGYIAARKSADDNKIRRLKNSLHLIGEGRAKTHKVFVDSKEALSSFDAARHFDTAPELLGRAFNRPRLLKLDTLLPLEQRVGGTEMGTDAGAGEGAEGAGAGTGGERRIDPSSVATSLTKDKRPAAPAAYRELRERVKRSRKLKKALFELQQQRSLTNSKGSKRKIVIPAVERETGNGKPQRDKVVYKWKKQRAT
ncbi:small-subunit processome [Ochromonadaceae sp. CCMP2298]|nr:small-subunit processome [Ochromonadaceae sp. CCMP2298]